MGTRSCIIVKVRPSDKGKTVKFDKRLIARELLEWIDKDREGKVWCDESGKERSQPVTLTGDYIGIYCHWDGYVQGGVGEQLKEDYNEYVRALNLVVGGDCSSIGNEGLKHYANRGREGMYCNEKWANIKPKQGNTQKSVFERVDCEYVYLFVEERGGWLYKHYPHSKNGFKPY